MQTLDSRRLGPLSQPYEWLSKLVDFCLAGVILVAPLFMGGRGPVGKFVFLGFIGTAAIAWSVRQCLERKASWRWSGAEVLLLAGMLIVVLQLIPLSPTMLGYLAPATSELLPLWSSAETSLGLGQWSMVTLDPEATRGALAVLLGYGMLFVLVVQRLNSLSDVERVLRWIAIAAVAMAVLGLAQLLMGNGKFLWVFAHPSRDTHDVVVGAFQNQNHFAHFLALGIGPLIWFLWSVRKEDALKHALAIGFGLVAIAGLLTFSRGGVITMVVAVLVCACVYYWKALLGRRSILAAAGLSAIVVVALGIYGYEPLARRLATLRHASSLEEVSHGRHALWSALWDAIPHFAPLGSGVGSHRNVYPIFMEEYFEVQFTHGESGYLQLLLETGAPGLILMLIGIILSLYWCGRALTAVRAAAPSHDRQPFRAHGGDQAGFNRSKRKSSDRSAAFAACCGAVLAGIVASAIHSIGDFVWYISACMSVTVILVGCGCRLYQLRSEFGAADEPAGQGVVSRFAGGCDRLLERLYAAKVTTAARPVWCAIAAVAAIAASAAVYQRLPAARASSDWNQYRKIALSIDRDTVLEESRQHEILDRMAWHLERALSFNPSAAAAHMRMAWNCLRRFELEQRGGKNPMPLSHVREAALASQFPSKQALDRWLAIAIGEHRALLDQAVYHCRRGLRLCPLRGEGYVYLTDLLFVEGYPSDAKQSFIAQAQRVRPHNGVVLFAVGQEAALNMDEKRAIAYWKRAFHQDREMRAVIVDSFAPNIPAGEFLEAFEPKMQGLALLYHHYRNSERHEDATVVGAQYVEALEAKAAAALEASQPAVASTRWYTAQAIHAYLGAKERALSSAQRAVEFDNRNFDKHHTLAAVYMLNGRFAEAAEEYRWCQRRRPDDNAVVQGLANANRQAALRSAASEDRRAVRSR